MGKSRVGPGEARGARRGQRLARGVALWQGARRTRGRVEVAGSCRLVATHQFFRRRSSVVERVIGNDEVLSSILSGGTMKSISYGPGVAEPLQASKHIVSTEWRFRAFRAVSHHPGKSSRRSEALRCWMRTAKHSSMFMRRRHPTRRTSLAC
jgi:hypothetical protein